MPELPEVETIRRDIEPHVIGRRIVRAWSSEGPRYGHLAAAQGREIEQLARRGKYLLVKLADRELVIHLGMSGRLFMASSRPESRHLRAVFELDDPPDLYFEDMRKFGQLAVVPAGQYTGIPTLAAMGPEPLSADFDVRAFARAAATIRAPIKAVLLGQKVVAGLGNIYADEALFRAGIHPLAKRLSRVQARRLHAAIREVLEAAIVNRGTTFSLYRDAHMQAGRHYQALRVYDRQGHPCPRCGAAILKTRIAGRGTHFCPVCQSLCSDRKSAGSPLQDGCSPSVQTGAQLLRRASPSPSSAPSAVSSAR